MALTKEALLIEVSASAKGAQKELDKTSESVKDLETQTKKSTTASSKSMQELEKKYSQLAKSISEEIEMVNQVNQKIPDSLPLKEISSMTDKAVKKTKESVNNADKAISDFTANVLKLGTAIASVATGFVVFGDLTGAIGSFFKGFRTGFAINELDKLNLAMKRSSSDLSNILVDLQAKASKFRSRFVLLKDALGEDVFKDFIQSGTRARQFTSAMFSDFPRRLRLDITRGLATGSQIIDSELAKIEIRPFTKRLVDGFVEGYDQVVSDGKIFSQAMKNIFSRVSFVARDAFIRISEGATRIRAFVKASTTGARRVDMFNRVVLETRFAFENIAKILGPLSQKFIKLPFLSLVDKVKRLTSSLMFLAGEAFTTVTSNTGAFGAALERTKAFGEAFVRVLSNMGKFITGLIPKFANLAKDGVLILDRVFTAIKTNEFVKSMLAAAKSMSTLKTSFLGLLEASVLVAPGLALFGGVLKQTKNTVLVLIGSLIELVGVILGGVASAFTFIVEKTAGFITAIGRDATNAMAEFIKLAIKAEQNLRQFTFVMTNFNRITEGATGSLDMWKDTVSAIAETSLFTTNSIRKASAIIVKESQVIGLSIDQMQKIIKVAADVAASSGNDITASAQAIINALTGSSQSLLGMGVDLRQSTLDHSKFAKELNKSTSEMSEEEKVLGRLSILFDQHKFVMGAAADATKTVAGSQALLDKNLLRVKERLGEQAIVVSGTTKLYNEILTTFLKLPPPIIEVTGTLIDIGGAFLQMAGTLISLLTFLPALVLAFNALNAAVIASAKAQAVLNAAIVLLNTNIKAQIVAVTSLGAFFKNLGLILKTIIVGGFVKTAGIIKGLAKRFITLKNVIAGLGIGLLIAFVLELNEAISEMADSLSIFQDNTDGIAGAIDGANQELSIFAKTFGFLKSILDGAILAFKSLAKFVGIGLLTSIVLATKAWIMFKIAITDNQKELKILRADLKSVNKDVNTLANQSRSTWLAMGEFIGVASSMSLAAKSLNKDMKNTRMELISLKDDLNRRMSVQAFDDLNVEVFGDQIEKAALKFNKANFEFARALSNLKNKSGEAAELEKQFEIALIEKERTRLELLKAKEDALKGLSDVVLKGDINELKNADEKIRLARIENEEVLKLFKIKRNSLIKTNALTKTEIDRLNKIEEKLIKQGKIRLEIARNDLIKKSSKDVLATVSKITVEQKKQAEELARLGTSEIELIELTTQRQIAEIDLVAQKVKALEISEKEKSVQLEQLEIARRTAIELGKKRTGEAKKKQGESGAGANIQAQMDIVNDTFRNLGQEFGGNVGANITSAGSEFGAVFSNITGDMIGGMGGMLTGAFSAIGTGVLGAADMFADAVLGLIDFFPKLIDKFAAIFNNLTDLPGKLADSISGLFDGIINFVQNFFPNLINAVGDILASVGDFLVNLPDVFIDMIENGLPNAIQSLLDRLPEIIEKILTGFISFFPKLIVGMIKIITKLFPKVVVAVVKAIPAIIEAVVKGIVEGIKEALNAVFSLFGMGTKDVAKKVEEQFKSVGKEATGAASRLFKVTDLSKKDEQGGKGEADKVIEAGKKAGTWLVKKWRELWKFLEKSWRKLWKFLEETWRGLWEGLVQLWRDLWNFVESMFQAIIDVFKAMWESVKELFMNIVNALLEVFGILADAVIKLVEGIIEGASVFDEKVIQPLGEALKAGGRAINQAALKLVDGLSEGASAFAKATGQFLTDFGNFTVQFVKDLGKFLVGLGNAAVELVKGIGETGSQIWEGFKNGVKQGAVFFSELGTKIWNGLEEAFNGAKDIIIGLGTQIWDGVTGAIKSIGTTFLDLGKDIWSGLLNGLEKAATMWLDLGKDIWSGLSDGISSIGTFFSDLGSQIWGGLKSGLESATEIYVGIGSKIWDGLKSGLSGITEIINTAIGKVGSIIGQIFPPQPNTQGGLEKKLGIDIPKISFAEGGMVPGRATFKGDDIRNDTFPAMLSPGEMVIPRSIMNDPASAGIIDALMSGKDIPMLHTKKQNGINIPHRHDVSVANLKKSAEALQKEMKDGAIGDIARGDFAAAASRLDPSKVSLDDIFGDISGKLMEKVVEGMKAMVFRQLAGGGMIGMQDGGIVPGTGRGDTVPTMLEPGELVVPRGRVNDILGGKTNEVNQEFDIKIEINTDEKVDDDFIRDRLVPSIMDEIRRESLEGKRVLESTGIR